MPTGLPHAQWAAALRRRDYASLQAWLKVHPDGLDQPLTLEFPGGPREERPLVWAVWTQQWDLAKKLVLIGASPNVKNADGTLTALEALAQGAAAAGWPHTVLDVVEVWLENGCDPHAMALPSNNPVLALCLLEGDLPSERKKSPVPTVKRDVALRIWEKTQHTPWPATVQWFAWFHVLAEKNQAWVQRLRMCGASPVQHDETLEITLAVSLGRNLSNDPVRLEKAFEVLAGFGLDWRCPDHGSSDEPLRRSFAKAKAHRLDQQLLDRSGEETAYRKRGRL